MRQVLEQVWMYSSVSFPISYHHLKFEKTQTQNLNLLKANFSYQTQDRVGQIPIDTSSISVTIKLNTLHLKIY